MLESKKPLFVAVGHMGLRFVSSDGEKWSKPQLTKDGQIFRAVAFGNNHYVAVGNYGGDNLFASSADGETWKTFTKNADSTIRGMGFGNKIFVAVGGDAGSVGDSRPFAMTTGDGEKWSEPTRIDGKHVLRRVAFGNERFVSVGDRGRRACSKDGLKWTEAAESKAIDTLVDLAFGKGVFVGVGLHGLRMTSEDGLKWTDRQVGEEGEHLNSILWAEDRFVAIGYGATYTSSDGKRWRRAVNKDAPQVAAYGRGLFVGAAWKGRLFSSTDGVLWRQVHKAEHNLEAIVWG